MEWARALGHLVVKPGTVIPPGGRRRWGVAAGSGARFGTQARWAAIAPGARALSPRAGAGAAVLLVKGPELGIGHSRTCRPGAATAAEGGLVRSGGGTEGARAVA